MPQEKNNNTIRLEKAQALVAALQAGRDHDAELLISELSRQKDSDLFLEVGRLTRQLHEAINSFLLDERIADMTAIEIPDAKERLNYVITMTQKSAERSLTAVEQSLPLARNLEHSCEHLLMEWEKICPRLIKISDCKALSDSLVAFLNKTKQDCIIIQGDLSDVQMAQDFQDLTGQIIRKVIRLVHDVEEKLVMLVRITGGRLEQKSNIHHDPYQLEGPRIPGIERGKQITNQDDVDDLLSSLGF
jgi:chemotaxis protein CheZ